MDTPHLSLSLFFSPRLSPAPRAPHIKKKKQIAANDRIRTCATHVITLLSIEDFNRNGNPNKGGRFECYALTARPRLRGIKLGDLIKSEFLRGFNWFCCAIHTLGRRPGAARVRGGGRGRARDVDPAAVGPPRRDGGGG